MASKTFCDVCGKEIPDYLNRWGIRLSAAHKYMPSGKGVESVIFPPHTFLDKDTCSAQCFITVLRESITQVESLSTVNPIGVT